MEKLVCKPKEHSFELIKYTLVEAEEDIKKKKRAILDFYNQSVERREEVSE